MLPVCARCFFPDRTLPPRRYIFRSRRSHRSSRRLLWLPLRCAPPALARALAIVQTVFRRPVQSVRTRARERREKRSRRVIVVGGEEYAKLISPGGTRS